MSDMKYEITIKIQTKNFISNTNDINMESKIEDKIFIRTETNERARIF